MRTSHKWKILEGHSKNVSCVEFDSKGNTLASYSMKDLTLRLWKVGNAGFFSTIMGGSGKSSKDFKLKPIEMPAQPASEKKKKIQRDDEKKASSVGSKVKVRFVNNDKALELIREDGSAELHKLVK